MKNFVSKMLLDFVQAIPFSLIQKMKEKTMVTKKFLRTGKNYNRNNTNKNVFTNLLYKLQQKCIANK